MRPTKGQRIAFSCGGSKGGNAPIWHTTLLAKCSVLYLLSRLPGKIRVSPDGNARFVRQENGQFIANGNEQKAGRLEEWQRVYKMSIFLNTLDPIQFLSRR